MNESRARRFVGEVVVIVGSILLAFALDAAWDDRQEQERVVELLTAVADDFDAEIASLDSVISVNRSRGALQAALFELTAPSAPPPAPDTIAVLRAQSGDQQIYDASFGALSALISSGGLERIDDRELRRRLAGWQAELVDLDWEREQAKDAVDGVLTSLRELQLMSAVIELDDFWPVRVDAMLRSASHREHEAQLNLLYVLYTDDLTRIRRRAIEVRDRVLAYIDRGR